MAKTITRGSMDLINELTQVPKWCVVSIGASSGSPDVDADATGAYTLMNFPAGVMILGVRTVITEAFTATANLNIGTSDDTAGLAPETSVACTVASSSLKVYTATGYFDATGKKDGIYFSATGLAILGTVDTAAPAAGKALVAVEYLII